MNKQQRPNGKSTAQPDDSRDAASAGTQATPGEPAGSHLVDGPTAASVRNEAQQVDQGSTSSAAAGESTPESGGRPTSSRAWRVGVPLVAVLAGLGFGVSASASRGTNLRSAETNLAPVVAAADHRVKEKQDLVAALRTDVETQQQRAAGSANAGAEQRLTKAADDAADPAGLTALSGQSVSVTLNDSTMSINDLPENGTPDWLVVHQQDVQGVVNALWRGGARGMMIMDQRVVSTSAVRCVGNTLILQGRVYSPPFTVRAIGDPVKLKASLDSDPAVKLYRDYVDLVGLGYDVKTSDHDTFPAFTGSTALEHAKPQR